MYESNLFDAPAIIYVVVLDDDTRSVVISTGRRGSRRHAHRSLPENTEQKSAPNQR